MELITVFVIMLIALISFRLFITKVLSCFLKEKVKEDKDYIVKFSIYTMITFYSIFLIPIIIYSIKYLYLIFFTQWNSTQLAGYLGSLSAILTCGGITSYYISTQITDHILTTLQRECGLIIIPDYYETNDLKKDTNDIVEKNNNQIQYLINTYFAMRKNKLKDFTKQYHDRWKHDSIEYFVSVFVNSIRQPDFDIFCNECPPSKDEFLIFWPQNPNFSNSFTEYISPFIVTNKRLVIISLNKPKKIEKIIHLTEISDYTLTFDDKEEFIKVKIELKKNEILELEKLTYVPNEELISEITSISCKTKTSNQKDIDKSNSYNQGVTYMENEQYDRAISAFEKYLRYFPDDEDTIFNMARSYACINDINNAKVYLDKCFDINPDLIKIALKTNELQVLNEYLQDTYKIYRREKEYEKIYNMGVTYFEDEQHIRAIQFFEQYLKHDPNDEDTLFNLACSYSYIGNLEQAKLYLDKCIGNNNKIIQEALNTHELKPLYDYIQKLP